MAVASTPRGQRHAPRTGLEARQRLLGVARVAGAQHERVGTEPRIRRVAAHGAQRARGAPPDRRRGEIRSHRRSPMPHTTRPPARSRTARGRPRSATARRGSAAAERGCRLSRHLLARLHHGVGRHAGVGLDNRARAHPRAPAPIIAPGSTRAPCAAPSRAWGRSRTWLYASGNAIPRGSRPDGRFWTHYNPLDTLANPRAELGLPDENPFRFLTEARVVEPAGIVVRPAAPLDGNPGGAPEVLVPDPPTGSSKYSRWRG